MTGASIDISQGTDSNVSNHKKRKLHMWERLPAKVRVVMWENSKNKWEDSSLPIVYSLTDTYVKRKKELLTQWYTAHSLGTKVSPNIQKWVFSVCQEYDHSDTMFRALWNDCLHNTDASLALAALGWILLAYEKRNNALLQSVQHEDLERLLFECEPNSSTLFIVHRTYEALKMQSPWSTQARELVRSIVSHTSPEDMHSFVLLYQTWGKDPEFYSILENKEISALDIPSPLDNKSTHKYISYFLERIRSHPSSLTESDLMDIVQWMNSIPTGSMRDGGRRIESYKEDVLLAISESPLINPKNPFWEKCALETESAILLERWAKKVEGDTAEKLLVSILQKAMSYDSDSCYFLSVGANTLIKKGTIIPYAELENIVAKNHLLDEDHQTTIGRIMDLYLSTMPPLSASSQTSRHMPILANISKVNLLYIFLNNTWDWDEKHIQDIIDSIPEMGDGHDEAKEALMLSLKSRKEYHPSPKDIQLGLKSAEPRIRRRWEEKVREMQKENRIDSNDDSEELVESLSL